MLMSPARNNSEQLNTKPFQARHFMKFAQLHVVVKPVRQEALSRVHKELFWKELGLLQLRE